MSSKITVLKASLLLLLADDVASLYTKHDKVERLDVDTFDAVTDSDALWLIEFFAPWCGHCQQLAPEWKAAAAQLADEIPDDVRLGAVDCTRNNGLCSKYKVDGYPTIKVFGEEKDQPTELSVGRTSADILTYVRGKLGRPAPPGSGEGAVGGDGTPGGGGGGGSAALDDAWKTTKLPELEATHLFTVAYAVALFAPKSQDDELSIHIVETAPNRVITRAFDWGNLGPLLRRVGHPCTDIKLTLISPHMDSSLHNTTKVYDLVQDCSVSAKFWRNFVDTSTTDQGFPEPDATVWLNVDAYMCPWRYSLLHSLSTGKPMVLSFFDERPAKSVQEMLSTTQRFRASFGEEQRTKCDEMSGTLYGFKWLAHKANQNWNLTDTINTALVDMFLPVAPNQFTAQDNDAPRYTDPTTLVTRPLGLNEWIVGVWYDQRRQSAGLKSIGERGAKKILAHDGAGGGHQEL